MRNPALLVALLCAAFATPVLAQATDAASQRLVLAGEATAACVYTPPSAGSASNASFLPTNNSSGRVQITQLVDGQTAMAMPSAIELTLPVISNAANRIEVRSANGGLLRVGGKRGGNGFAEFLPYRIGLDWAGVTLNRSSDAGAAGISSSLPNTGEMRLRISTQAGRDPLVSGQYNDTIVVDFQVAY